MADIVVKKGNIGFDSLKAALATAEEGDVFTLVADCSLSLSDHTTFAPAGITLNGDNYSITVDAFRMGLIGTNVFNMVKFINAGYDNLFDLHSDEVVNVTFSNCTFSGRSTGTSMNYIQAGGIDGSKFSGSITVKGCRFDNIDPSVNRDVRVVFKDDAPASLVVKDCTFVGLGADPDQTPVKASGRDDLADCCTIVNNYLSDGTPLYAKINGSAIEMYDPKEPKDYDVSYILGMRGGGLADCKINVVKFSGTQPEMGFVFKTLHNVMFVCSDAGQVSFSDGRVKIGQPDGTTPITASVMFIYKG